MLRRMVLMGIVVFVVVLVLPTSAVAGRTWNVRDAKGRLAGTVTLKTVDGKRYAEVIASGGAESPGGWVEPRSWGALVQWYRLGLPYAKKVLPTDTGWRTPYFKGILRRSGDRWIASRLVNGTRRRVAGVSAACPGRYAIGAAMILCFPAP